METETQILAIENEISELFVMESVFFSTLNENIFSPHTPEGASSGHYFGRH